MKLYFLCILTGFSLRVSANSGGESSGGGNVVVCFNQNEEIKTIELLDLYEGRHLHHLSFPPNNTSYLEQALTVAKNIDQAWTANGEGAYAVEGFVKRLNKELEFLPNGIGLAPIDDSEHIIIPPKNSRYFG